jgi:hypothetical protein
MRAFMMSDQIYIPDEILDKAISLKLSSVEWKIIMMLAAFPSPSFRAKPKMTLAALMNHIPNSRASIYDALRKLDLRGLISKIPPSKSGQAATYEVILRQG